MTRKQKKFILAILLVGVMSISLTSCWFYEKPMEWCCPGGGVIILPVLLFGLMKYL